MGGQTRNSALTYRGNLGRGRHGWLRLTPAYSLKVVEELLDAAPPNARVLDPFSGTATTTLAASQRRHVATSCDINPFLIWLGESKLRRYTGAQLDQARALGRRAAEAAEARTGPPRPPPPMHHIERWWHAESLDFLCRLARALEDDSSATSAAGRLVRVAFCRTLMGLSNAAFDHVSMSFDDGRPELTDRGPMRARFMDDLEQVLASATPNPPRRGRVLACDARILQAIDAASFDLVITSPPYPNRMSYVRELRPYMYWMGYLKEAREAGELDWRAIGGTWGVATSRLTRWQPSRAMEGETLATLLPRVAEASAKNGPLLARYLERYFEDMGRHLDALLPKLSAGARVHYVVGNSTFYGVLVPVERLFAEMMARRGLREVSVRTLRKRNSKKELYEFVVSALRD